MPFVVLLILFWLLAVLTALEMATFSARRERMTQAAQAGDRRALTVVAFQRSPADYLSAIQLLATAANFVIGALIGANIEQPIRQWIDSWLPGFDYRHYLSWTLSIGLVTVVALIFTNVLPKHIGFVRANEMAVRTAPFMRFWIKVTWPVTYLVRKVTKLLARLMHVAPDEKFRVTEKDIDTLLAEGVRAGSLNPTEQAMMRRALKLSDIPLAEAMVPRERLLWVERSWSERKLAAFFREHRRSNFPVCDGGLDRVVGVVRTLDWFLERDLERVMDPAVFARPDDSLLVAMEALRPVETRLLIVRDESGVCGVLTLNDLLASIVGPIRQT